jgi:hypothetical protein
MGLLLERSGRQAIEKSGCGSEPPLNLHLNLAIGTVHVVLIGIPESPLEEGGSQVAHIAADAATPRLQESCSKWSHMTPAGRSGARRVETRLVPHIEPLTTRRAQTTREPAHQYDTALETLKPSGAFTEETKAKDTMTP